MKGYDVINKLLSKKGYQLREATFDAISYSGREGREGGWYVEIIENEEDENFPNWKELKIPEGIIGAFMPEAFICYNLKDALKIIEVIPNYNIK